MNLKKTILFIILLLPFFVTLNKFVKAQTSYDSFRIGGNEEDEENNSSEEIDSLEKKIEKLEKKLAETKSKGQSLSREIDIVDNQIALTETRIEKALKDIKKTEEDIAELGIDIDDFSNRIEILADRISVQENVLNERVRAKYMTGESSEVMVLFGSTTINSAIQKSEYLKVLAKRDKELIDRMSNTRKASELQKSLLEDKKEKEEQLKQQLVIERSNLEQYNSDLEKQKNEKDLLLKQTQNDEKKYQSELEAAQKELNQILSAVSVLKDQKPRDVEKGELIGIQGNTGYSSGEHLHFGVYRYSSFEDITDWNWYYSNNVDPAKKLKSKDVYWNTGCESSGTRSTGKGDWEWPVNNPTISQGYGHTCWSNLYYNGNIHPAYDMYGSTGAPVYAVEDGKAYFCKNCLGDGGNGVFIFHKDDYMTVYWHLR